MELTEDAAALMEEHYPPFRRWVERRQRLIPHLSCEIEDAAWSAFELACRRWAPQRYPRFETYLYTYLRGRKPCRLRAGRSSRRPPAPLRDDRAAAPGGPDPGDLLDLHAALGRLCDADRTLLGLIYDDGLNYREAGERLGWGYATTWDRHARILADLRRLMDVA